MGGSDSKISCTTVNDITCTTLLNQVQNCITYYNGVQTIATYGDGNDTSHNRQKMSMKFISSCATKADQKSSIVSSIQNKITQSLKDSGVAMTQWADCGSDTVDTTITNNVNENISIDFIQNCLSDLNQKQTLLTSGSGNVTVGNMQEQTANIVKSCMQNGSQTGMSTSAVSNTASQYMEKVSANPMQFLADMVSSVMSGPMLVIGFIFVVLIILAVVFFGAKKKVTDAMEDVVFGKDDPSAGPGFKKRG
jgi:hypothetical protein